MIQFITTESSKIKPFDMKHHYLGQSKKTKFFLMPEKVKLHMSSLALSEVYDGLSFIYDIVLFLI
jgi:hypothetical protein